MGPRRRHQEVLSKQREDGGNFKPPGSLLNRHISFKTLTAYWPEGSGIVEVCGRAICSAYLFRNFKAQRSVFSFLSV